MDLSLLKALSEADAIASSEQEVRQILLDEADRLHKTGIPLQLDMFSNGGTDGGAVHVSGTGIPTVVLGPATRHGHCAASIADCRDISQTQQLLSALISHLTRETVVHLTDFRC